MKKVSRLIATANRPEICLVSATIGSTPTAAIELFV